MRELSSDAQALVRAGRNALRPSEVDRDRVFAALRERLGEARDAASAGTTLLSPAASKALAGATIGLVLVGGGAFFALRGPPTDAAQTASSVQRIARPASRPSSAASRRPMAPIGPAPSQPTNGFTTVPRAAAPPPTSLPARRAPDLLAQEVAILSRVTSELFAGRSADALRALDEHQRRFPNGVLVEERQGARIQALCTLGHQAQADSEIARLAQIAPDSPHVRRAQQFCSAASKAVPPEARGGG
jgi:hypothetical protein